MRIKEAIDSKLRKEQVSSGKLEDVQSRYLQYETTSSSADSGRHLYPLTSLISTKHLTALGHIMEDSAFIRSASQVYHPNRDIL